MRLLILSGDERKAAREVYNSAPEPSMKYEPALHLPELLLSGAFGDYLKMPVLELRSASKDYFAEEQPVRALHQVSLRVERGEFVALVGRSGCGKSTLLSLAGAMDFPTKGEVLVDGQSTAALNDAALTKLRREKVGFIFQSFQLLHTLTVIENVELPLLLAGKNNARGVARERLTWVELAGLEHRFPHQLSGGQMQRVAIARSLVQSPAILLADEPTGNLDTATGNVILELLRRLTKENNTATLMATHSAEAAAMADTIVRLRDGEIADITRRRA
jgi:ABC-type lipoprotein export system ATPase subunit